MKIDGVDFWHSNRHIVRMWDNEENCGPLVVLIDEKVRVGKDFIIYSTAEEGLYRLLQRQTEYGHEFNMMITVIDKKTGKDMYNVLLKVILVGIKFGDIDYTNSETTEIFLTYKCLSAEDITNYDT